MVFLFSHDEGQYLDQLRYIMEKGTVKSDRTGVGTLSVFGMQSRYSLDNGTCTRIMKVEPTLWKLKD